MIRYRVLSATASPVMTALTNFSRASPVAGSTTCIVGAVRSMPVICAERVNETLPSVSRARKQTYCPFCSSLFRVIPSPEVYAVPSVSPPMRPASQSSEAMAYLLPATAASPAIAALTAFSCAVPAAGLVTDIAGPVRSIPAICAERAKVILFTVSRARKQTRCPLYTSSSRVMFSPEVYAVPSVSLPMRSLSQSSVVMAYRLPAVIKWASAIFALIFFCSAAPEVGSVILIVGLTRSMPSIRAD